MNFIDRLERSKFGRFGIPGLMRYVIAVSVAGTLLGIANSDIYYNYLCLDIHAILHGQIWRLVTFLLAPNGDGSLMNMLWFAIWIFVYYSIGTNLERMWGTFRFNLFYFSGLLYYIVLTFIFYFLMQAGVVTSLSVAMDYATFSGVLDYLNETLFLAFAFAFPNAQFLIYFVIPIKAKWLGIVYLVLDGLTLVQCFMNGYYYTAFVILVLLLNFVVFYFAGNRRPTPRQAYQQKRRQEEYKKKASPINTGARHRCAICGRTEIDAPDLDFRYCSKCDGNYEYCSDHLFTHEHVHHTL